ncbi:hypothetical protein L226DRAFT_571823 [Lentinus tigrinus ALCF2SS1-7]|uniref:Uncharacterized protein n=1 Tax=Lentinus tigrinus ALCF2SS1-6 TaxID=1328759 RepID=A0A5C2RSV0_9APHY|nr:hypothetical protein L227DRAFT_616029 [Lentinus tigrinus ALCF2SS1-6]RPD73917.1 hypothetical protein L226DRAFT_571823 [Lentinus tigrinus ALCF2SS1-7]
MTINFKKLAECIMLKDEEENVHYPEPWELHPGSTTTSVEFGCTCSEAVEKWEQHKNVQRQYIPHCIRLHQDRIAEQEKKKCKISQGGNTKGSAKKKSKTSTVKVPDSRPNTRKRKARGKTRMVKTATQKNPFARNHVENTILQVLLPPPYWRAFAVSPVLFSLPK